MKYVHIGGTNGKGSTAAMVSSILSYAGYKVGTYTSPHLTDFTERIAVKGKKIGKEDVVRLFGKLMPVAERMEKDGDGITFFEFATALAIEHFAENKVDIAVMEVGIGGRLDATNVIDPIVSVITNIGLEHTDILGDTREKIAREKAGIIKSNSSLVTSADPAIYALLRGICRERNSEHLPCRFRHKGGAHRRERAESVVRHRGLRQELQERPVQAHRGAPALQRRMRLRRH